jgi:hypothetical protein
MVIKIFVGFIFLITIITIILGGWSLLHIKEGMRKAVHEGEIYTHDIDTNYYEIKLEDYDIPQSSSIAAFAESCVTKGPADIKKLLVLGTAGEYAAYYSKIDNPLPVKTVPDSSPETEPEPEPEPSQTPTPTPTQTPTPTTTPLPLFADLTNLHSSCEVLGTGVNVCPDNQKLCFTEGADPKNCCDGNTKVSIQNFDNEKGKVTWRCTQTSGLPWGGLKQCPPGYKLAHVGNWLSSSKSDTCVKS